jgi:long-chain acyl-CoA synthetase
MLGNTSTTTSSTSYPWLRHYPAGVDWFMPIRPETLPQLFETAVAEHAAKPCLDFMGRSWTYAQVGDEVLRVATGLRALGVGPGTRVGLCLPNCPYYVTAYFAVLHLGAVVVNFNPLYTANELAAQAADAGAEVMVAPDLDPILGRVLSLLEKGTVKHVVACRFAAALPWVKGQLFRLVKRKNIAAIPSDRRVVDFATLQRAAPLREPAVPKPEDLAVLQYTGGTTGTPKGAMLTHANLAANVRQAQAWAPDIKPGGQRIMGVLPFFHVFALTSILNAGIAWGAQLIMLPRFEVKPLLATIRRTRPTIFHGVPTLFKALLDNGATTQDLSGIALCISGGAPLPMEIKKAFDAVSGRSMLEGYGLTETSPVAFCTPLAGDQRPGTIGLPVPGVRAEIRDPEQPQRRMAFGERGEVCLAGPNIMRGYWNRPEETAKSFTPDGMLRTGDIGIMDEDGYVTLVDRLKDLIICSGYNVYPRTIEEALYEHPDVVAATALGMPDEYRGESPAAFVELRPGATTTVDELRAHLKDRLNPIEMPKLLEIRPSLPRTAVGKLSKKELKAELTGPKA